jgi:hypothetical protein
MADKNEQPTTPPATPREQGERIEKADKGALRGSGYAPAQPIQAATGEPAEIPQAFLGTPAPEASAGGGSDPTSGEQEQ